MSPRLLVTGSGGFVGRHLCQRARDAGWEVFTVAGNLCEDGVATAAVQEAMPDAIAHLAAPSRLVRRDPWETLRLEVTMLSRLMAAIRTHSPDAAVLAVGSAAQYGTGADRPLTEDDPIAPVSPAGTVKAVLERAFTAEALHGGLRAIWCRSFNHAGPGQGVDSPGGSWARQLVDAERAGGGSIQVGTLDVVRDILDVRDVADAYLALLGEPRASGVFNVCSGEAVALRHVVEALLVQASTEVALQPDPSLVRPNDPPRVVGDPSHLKATTGWRAGIALEQTLRDAVAELRQTSDAAVTG